MIYFMNFNLTLQFSSVRGLNDRFSFRLLRTMRTGSILFMHLIASVLLTARIPIDLTSNIFTRFACLVNRNQINEQCNNLALLCRFFGSLNWNVQSNSITCDVPRLDHLLLNIAKSLCGKQWIFVLNDVRLQTQYKTSD